MKEAAMKGILILWMFHVSVVTSAKIKAFPIWYSPAGGGDGPVPRVYGGLEAKEGEYPFMILMLYKYQLSEGHLKCSASLLANDWVLTAAHCIPREYADAWGNSRRLGTVLRNIILVGGRANLTDYHAARFSTIWNETVNERELGVEERRAKSILIHPGFIHTEEGLEDDVALIKLDKPFTLMYIKPIPLSFEKITKRITCTIMGWGLTLSGESKQLNVVREQEVSTTSIGCKYASDKPLICLMHGNSGFCSGDSGSPLVCDGMVRGVASYMLTNYNSCGKSLEDYYMELSSQRQWFESVLNKGNVAGTGDIVRVFVCMWATLWLTRSVLN